MSKEEKELKTAFAAAWLKNPADPYKAAFSIIADTSEALKAAQLWVEDSFVASEKLRLLGEQGISTFLPDKDDLLKMVWAIVANDKIDAEVKLKAGRFYAELRNYIEKPTIGGNSIVNNGVMVIERHGNDEEWEKECKQQQAALAERGKTINAC